MMYWWLSTRDQMPDLRPGESDIDVRERRIRKSEFGQTRFKQYESHKPRGEAHDDGHGDGHGDDGEKSKKKGAE